MKYACKKLNSKNNLKKMKLEACYKTGMRPKLNSPRPHS